MDAEQSNHKLLYSVLKNAGPIRDDKGAKRA